jgi:hypothetical protein
MASPKQGGTKLSMGNGTEIVSAWLVPVSKVKTETGFDLQKPRFDI